MRSFREKGDLGTELHTGLKSVLHAPVFIEPDLVRYHAPYSGPVLAVYELCTSKPGIYFHAKLFCNVTQPRRET
jgi:hypothetical protein